jgi:hypothetical protein
MVRAASGREQRAAPDGIDPRVHAAVTDMYAYVLLLDAERRRVGERLQEAGTVPPPPDQHAQLTELRVELTEEVDALREAAVTLQEQAVADPGRGS